MMMMWSLHVHFEDEYEAICIVYINVYIKVTEGVESEVYKSTSVMDMDLGCEGMIEAYITHSFIVPTSHRAFLVVPMLVISLPQKKLTLLNQVSLKDRTRKFHDSHC